MLPASPTAGQNQMEQFVELMAARQGAANIQKLLNELTVIGGRRGR
jgi:hypothetical protein